MGAWYYTSCCIQWNCQMHFIADSQRRSEVYYWSQSIVHSQPARLMLQIKLSRCSQVHSRSCSQRRSQLHSMAPSQPAWLTIPSMLRRYSQAQSRTHSQWHCQAAWQVDYMLRYKLLGARSRDLLSWRRQVLRGRWWEEGGGSRNHDVGQCHCPHHIISVATVMRPHDASWSWCCQLSHYILQDR